ncbi:FAD:protein FMN transferase [Dactylosporangium sucinum]|uniref:FAD:protein FMN transferase n=1 Tax=Dactylosporangium sucinum TaxID=1424081 RepID=A0A917TYD8_9ACTN|nr:FAD:protein FMN transferase [Dactylosporangium sucinum]GGM44483.1 FAD:protein FMN transferase [Dactylosporangium sucinum]
MTTATVPRRAWVEQVMGLPVSIHVRGDDPDSPGVRRGVEAAFAGLRHADAVFSPYRDDSDLTRWERGDLAAGAADPTFAEVLALCDEARERTGGWFDPRGLPDPRTGAPRFDPSGLVKGWAVERAAGPLRRLQRYSWCINAGGDVLVHAEDHHPAWRVGIEDPTHPALLLHVLERRDGAVATSGTAHRGGHILDPYTRRPAGAVRSVTVTGPDLLWADVYATAAAARGPRGLHWLDTLDGYAALLVSASGLRQVTTAWPTA